MDEQTETRLTTTEVDRHTGDLMITHQNGDYVLMHMSRFHGLIVTTGRKYIGGVYKETTAYAGDPAAVREWLDRLDDS